VNRPFRKVYVAFATSTVLPTKVLQRPSGPILRPPETPTS